ncbi:glycosyltransferase [Amaricoccus tamworthensis]|uniref:glycosyltransferase n=1 Tax=Amaricoccus tamworthensis TaxID=57002 RepID=UPI003C7C4483
MTVYNRHSKPNTLFEWLLGSAPVPQHTGTAYRSKLHILHVCETSMGGIGSYLNLFTAFLDNGIVSRVVVPDQHSVQLDTRVETIPFNRSKRGIAPLFGMLRRMFGALRKPGADIVFFHSTFALLGLLAMRATFDRRPAIYCPHGWAICRYTEGSWKYHVVRHVEGLLCGLADIVVNISAPEQRLALENGYRGRHVLLENAVPDAAPDASDDIFGDEGALHLLFVGRLDHQKGIDILLNALENASQVRNDLRLHVVGSSVNEDASLLSMSHVTSSFGWVDKKEIDDFYSSADALVVPSRWEGFGLVVAEALRNGTPALVSTSGALPGLIEPGRTGHVFEPNTESLTSLLLGLDRKDLRNMRPASRQYYLDRFTVEKFRREFLNIISEVLAEKAVGRNGKSGAYGFYPPEVNDAESGNLLR